MGNKHIFCLAILIAQAAISLPFSTISVVEDWVTLHSWPHRGGSNFDWCLKLL